MSEHFIRNEANLDGCRRIRDLFRAKMPSGREGFVALDLDLVLRWHGPGYGLDHIGALALVEVKFGDATLSHGQVNTLKLFDWLLRGVAEPGRYLGCYLIHDYGNGTYRFHGQPPATRLTEDDLVRWANLAYDAPCLFTSQRGAA